MRRDEMALSVHGVRQQPGASLLGDFGCFGLIGEQAEVMKRVAGPNFGTPLPEASNPRDTTERRGRPAHARPVLLVPLLRQGTQIRSAAVQSVAADVVTISAVSVHQPKDGAVQRYAVLPIGVSVRTVGIAIRQPPRPLTYPRSVGNINDGVRKYGSVAIDQRYPRPHAIGIHDDRRRRWACDAANPRAVRSCSGAFLQAMCSVGERLPATGADSGNGTIGRHRDFPLTRNRGAQPPRCSRTEGASSFLNFTVSVAGYSAIFMGRVHCG